MKNYQACRDMLFHNKIPFQVYADNDSPDQPGHLQQADGIYHAHKC